MNKLLVSVATSIALFAVGPSVAQQSPASSAESSGYSSPAAASTHNANYSDAELKKFIEAQEGITEVREEYIEKIESADSQQKAQELQMKANEKMASVIEEAGMDIPTYNAIATAYSTEPKVRHRIEALM
ncbi:MAG TPA: DUF4168 domain-containing protein [Marinobacter sp.]|nr:DUF4168 domain-containing protein [Marinobacter sp.]